MLPLLLCLLAADPLAEARDHLNHGRYEEALDAYASAAESGADSTAIALGVSRIRIETGLYDEAATALEDPLKQNSQNADVLARRAELRLLRGDIPGATIDAEAALKASPDHPAARLARADALTEAGRIDEAADEYRWFVRFYNRTQPKDAETLVTVARGTLRYARWKRVTSVFHFVISDLCPDIAKADPDDWRADAISGSLLLEKYNEAQGVPDLERALAKNPSAAEVHAALAATAVEEHEFEEASQRIDAALRMNPAFVPALGLKADIAVAEGNFEQARPDLDAALAVNPHDQDILARVAALGVLSGEVNRAAFTAAIAAIEAGDAMRIETDSEFGRVVADLLRRNPKPGRFLYRLGATLEGRRRYPEAERAYEAAVKVMPKLPEPQVALGLLAMRAGDLDRTKTILDAAFKADPFHVRVSNMRKVVGLLESYETLETPHFLIRFDPTKDRVLAELTAEYLEAEYPKLTGEFGFEPPGKTVVELFQTGSGQSGHEWFAARMVGLPWLQTIGASTGLMIALASPTATQEYNWARVVRHEFTHVITLQQTDFRVPTWYTEALAVRSEGYPRPEEWDDLLRKRVPEGELRTLDELDEAFVSPDTPDDWQFAYCQSLLYAEDLDERFGGDVHRKLLGAYARGLTTTEAIAEATGVTADKLEEGYRERLWRVAESLGPATDADELTTETREALEDAVRAVRRKKPAEAIELLEAVFDHDEPQPQVLELLGKVKLLNGDAESAAGLFALGREKFPRERKWVKLHAAALLKAGDSPELKPLLEEIANTDADEALAPKKLAELAAAGGDAAATKRWAMRALYVTPDDASLHRLLGDACEKLGESDRAARARRHVALLEGAAAGDDETDKGE